MALITVQCEEFARGGQAVEGVGKSAADTGKRFQSFSTICRHDFRNWTMQRQYRLGSAPIRADAVDACFTPFEKARVVQQFSCDGAVVHALSPGNLTCPPL